MQWLVSLVRDSLDRTHMWVSVMRAHSCLLIKFIWFFKVPYGFSKAGRMQPLAKAISSLLSIPFTISFLLNKGSFNYLSSSLGKRWKFKSVYIFFCFWQSEHGCENFLLIVKCQIWHLTKTYIFYTIYLYLISKLINIDIFPFKIP